MSPVCSAYGMYPSSQALTSSAVNVATGAALGVDVAAAGGTAGCVAAGAGEAGARLGAGAFLVFCAVAVSVPKVRSAAAKNVNIRMDSLLATGSLLSNYLRETFVDELFQRGT